MVDFDNPISYLSTWMKEVTLDKPHSMTKNNLFAWYDQKNFSDKNFMEASVQLVTTIMALTANLKPMVAPSLFLEGLMLCHGVEDKDLENLTDYKILSPLLMVASLSKVTKENAATFEPESVDNYIDATNILKEYIVARRERNAGNKTDKV